jgi:hypothetical protein
MKEKFLELLGSRRFWQLTAATILQIVRMYLPDLEPLFNVLTVYLLAVVAIGTVDKISK